MYWNENLIRYDVGCNTNRVSATTISIIKQILCCVLLGPWPI